MHHMWALGFIAAPWVMITTHNQISHRQHTISQAKEGGEFLERAREKPL